MCQINYHDSKKNFVFRTHQTSHTFPEVHKVNHMFLEIYLLYLGKNPSRNVL